MWRAGAAQTTLAGPGPPCLCAAGAAGGVPPRETTWPSGQLPGDMEPRGGLRGVPSPLCSCVLRRQVPSARMATTPGAPQGLCLVSAALPEPVDMKTVRPRVPVGREDGQGSGALAVLFWVHWPIQPNSC